MPQFDRSSVRRLYLLVIPFFKGELKWLARSMLFLLFLLSLAIKGADVIMSYIGRDFMTALSLREDQKFMHNLYLYLMAFGFAIPLAVFYRYSEERLALLWRKWLTKRTLDLYMSNKVYYRLGWYGKIDNPDQRIEEDIRSFTSMSLSLFLIFLQSCLALFAFIGVLSSISWKLTLAAALYAIVGSIVTYLLGKPLINLNFEQLRREADFRYKLIKVRDNSESIAFYGGESKEKTRVRQRLKDVLKNTLRIINRNRILNFFTTGYNYMVIILPTIVVAPQYLRGEIEFGVVTQSAVAFGHVLNALSVIVTNFGSLSAYVAVVKRLGAFTETLSEAASEAAEPDVREFTHLKFSKVSILTPDASRILVKDLSFEINTGGLLICGPSGCGKSSILRTIGGLWNTTSGVIERPPLSVSMFLPQRPYLIIGSLRSQLVYGQHHQGFTDDELFKALEAVGLEEMFKRVGGFGAQVDWSTTLSNGEQQKVGLARLMLKKPPYVYLDEATTAIDESDESRIYRGIQSFAKIIVSIGYRTNLQHFHNEVLELSGDGNWTIEKVGEGVRK